MKDRSLRVSWLLVACAAVDACGACYAATEVSPSVIIILVDDLGVADVSFSARRLNNGYAPIETSNLDALAEHQQSAQLTNAFTHMLCGPSRAALVTGRLAHKLGNPFPMVEGGSLDVKFKTVGQEFKLRGYSTHFVGKWGIDYPRPTDEVLDRPEPTYETFNGHSPGMGPTERGFDSFYGLYSSAHNHYTKEIVYPGVVDWHRHNETHKLDYPDVDHEPKEYSTHLFTREAIDVIKTWSPHKPGFLHLSYTAPHDPLQAPNEYLDLPSCRQMKNWRRRTFCGMVSAIDEGVGSIRRALKDQGLADNTVILFTTDNGGAPTVGGFNYPYRGQKTTIYEGGFRTPAFLHIPEGLGAKMRGNHYTNTMHIADFSPTLLGIVDRACDQNKRLGNYEALGSDIDGVDHTEYILRSLSGKQFDQDGSSKEPPRKTTVLEFSAFFDHTAYLEGEWKLLLGSAGRADRFTEPTGKYFDSAGRPRFVVEEKACDVIDALGPNWFIYGWGMRFVVDVAFGIFQPSSKRSGEVARNRTAFQIATIRNNPFNATVSITEERLPLADFSKFDPSEIQLYNLREDPFEDRNVAFANKDRVKGMLSRLQDEVRHDPGHYIAVQKFMWENTIMNVLKALIVCISCLAVSVICVVCHIRNMLSSRCRGAKEKVS